MGGKVTEEIQKELLNAGWQQDIIDEAIKQVSIEPRINQVGEPAGLKKKTKLLSYLIAVVIVLIIAGVFSFLLLSRSQEKKIDISTTKDAEFTLATTNTILSCIGEKRYTDALQYFIYGGEGEPTKDDILTTLALVELSYRDKGEFNSQTSLDNIEVLENDAQVLAEFTINGQRSTLRFDFRKIGSDWKVNKVTIGGELTLLTEKEAISVFDNYTAKDYFTSTKSFSLSGNDTIEIKKNVLSSKENIEFKIINPQVGYWVAVGEPPYIRSYKEIRAQSTFTNYYDLSLDFFKTTYGLLLVYPEGTKISLTQSEISEEPILQIPFKIEAK